MGSVLKEYFQGNNFKENSYKVGGAVIGTLAPIVGLKYLLSTGLDLDSTMEIASWIGSLGLNMGSLIVGKPQYSPSFWGFVFGGVAGSFLANRSKDKRQKKEYIDNILSEMEKDISFKELDHDLKRGLNFPELLKEYRRVTSQKVSPFNTKIKTRKYNKKIADITEHLKSVPLI